MVPGNFAGKQRGIVGAMSVHVDQRVLELPTISEQERLPGIS